jgi:hypothetical protein
VGDIRDGSYFMGRGVCVWRGEDARSTKFVMKLKGVAGEFRTTSIQGLLEYGSNSWTRSYSWFCTLYITNNYQNWAHHLQLLYK